MSYQKDEAYIDKDYRGDVTKLVIQLPHSCDEWVIGNADDARQLIADLETLIVQYEKEVT